MEHPVSSYCALCLHNFVNSLGPQVKYAFSMTKVRLQLKTTDLVHDLAVAKPASVIPGMCTCIG
jgi:hypothetical protein